MKLLLIALLLSAGANAQTFNKPKAIDTLSLSNDKFFSSGGGIITTSVAYDTSTVWIAYADTSVLDGPLHYTKAKAINSRFTFNRTEYRSIELGPLPKNWIVIMAFRKD